MTSLTFEWDERKNRANRTKHGVSFEEAQTAFLDENARIIPDPEHSAEEDRFILLGLSIRLRVLIVCHCFRDPDNAIRIFSARPADPSERRDYARWLK
ncbi:MAG: BrnT family toxin [Pseudomonadota bacterium]|nr:BrnT family toxin [Pseudomonadota bacterium]